VLNIQTEKFILEFGFNSKNIETIKSFYPLNELKTETLFLKLQTTIIFFLNQGYSRNDIISIINTFPAIITSKTDTLKQKYEYFIKMGYLQNDIIKMTKSNPQIYSLSIQNIQKKYEELIELGYTHNNIIKITKSFSIIYCLNIESIKKKINEIEKLGFNYNDVIKMTNIFPCIYSYSIKNMEQKISDIMSLGYSKDEVIKIIKSLPSILGLNIKNIKEKLNFYNSITLSKFIINNPKYLMQSVELSYARYMFLTSSGLIIDETNYYRIFLSQKRFKASYNIDTDKLISMYDYNKIKGEKRK